MYISRSQEAERNNPQSRPHDINTGIANGVVSNARHTPASYSSTSFFVLLSFSVRFLCVHPVAPPPVLYLSPMPPRRSRPIRATYVACRRHTGHLLSMPNRTRTERSTFPRTALSSELRRRRVRPTAAAGLPLSVLVRCRASECIADVSSSEHVCLSSSFGWENTV